MSGGSGSGGGDGAVRETSFDVGSYARKTLFFLNVRACMSVLNVKYGGSAELIWVYPPSMSSYG